MDLFIVNDNNFSLKMEFIDVGMSSIVSGFVYLITCLIYFLTKSNVMFNFNFKGYKSHIKENMSVYFKNFFFAGLETTIRNLLFSLIILKTMSMVGKQGTYWVTNSFIWTWLLLPITIISLFIKETDAKHNIFWKPKNR